MSGKELDNTDKSIAVWEDNELKEKIDSLTTQVTVAERKRNKLNNDTVLTISIPSEVARLLGLSEK